MPGDEVCLLDSIPLLTGHVPGCGEQCSRALFLVSVGTWVSIPFPLIAKEGPRSSCPGLQEASAESRGTVEPHSGESPEQGSDLRIIRDQRTSRESAAVDPQIESQDEK